MKKIALMLMLLVALEACGKGQESSKTSSFQQKSASGVPSLPAAPLGISTLSGDGTVTVRWSAVNGVDSYNLYISQKAGAPKEEATKITGIKETSYAQKDLQNSLIHYYRVSAVSKVGEGALSAETGAMPKSSPPPVPAGVAAMGGTGKIILKWEAAKGADSYNVYFSTKPQVERSKRTKISGVTKIPYEHTDVKKKTMYFYVVSAVNGGGESPLSTESGAMP